MLKKILMKIKYFENQKIAKIDKQKDIQKDIEKIEGNLKKLYSLKKEYEKLEKNIGEFFTSK